MTMMREGVAGAARGTAGVSGGGAWRSVPAGGAQVPPSPRALALLGRADSLLAQAECARAGADGDRFRLAYIAAARGAAALLAAFPVPLRRGASRSVWAQLAAVDQRWRAWADHFAQHSDTRQAVEAGITSRVDAAAADALVHAAHRFLDQVEAAVRAGGGGGAWSAPAAPHPLSRAS